MRHKVFCTRRFDGRLGDDQQVQAAADYVGDVSERRALVGDPVLPGSRGTLLKRQPEEMGSNRTGAPRVSG
jgi:hypothetical protein